MKTLDLPSFLITCREVNKSMLVILSSKDLFDFCEAKCDYVFAAEEDKVYYKIEDGKLKSYVYGHPTKPSKNGNSL